jgi:hypothetical protein
VGRPLFIPKPPICVVGAEGTDKKKMRELHVNCLTTIEDFTAKDILAVRERKGVSHAVFASCLNVTTNWRAAGAASARELCNPIRPSVIKPTL